MNDIKAIDEIKVSIGDIVLSVPQLEADIAGLENNLVQKKFLLAIVKPVQENYVKTIEEIPQALSQSEVADIKE